MSDSYTDKSGEKQEKTEWIGIVAWKKTAELCGEYLRKGSCVAIQGRIQTREWEKDGVKRYTTEIVADRVTFLDKKSDGEKRDTGGTRRNEPAPYDFGGNKPSGGGGGYERDGEQNGRHSGAPSEDDIPFLRTELRLEITPK